MDGGGGSVDIDDTLTQSGKAADAKTVGDALKLKYGIDGGDIQAINVTSSLTTDSGINVDFNGNRLKDVGDPVENGDAVNKNAGPGNSWCGSWIYHDPGRVLQHTGGNGSKAGDLYRRIGYGRYAGDG